MNIGEASLATGISAKMIRYYEQIGMVTPAERSKSNYRIYNEVDLNNLRFIKRSKALGFSLSETDRLLKLWQDKTRESSSVKAIAQQHIDELEAKITEMKSMVETLQQLTQCCSGNERPDCPILDDLSGSISNSYVNSNWKG